jgi:hypothetical protein
VSEERAREGEREREREFDVRVKRENLGNFECGHLVQGTMSHGVEQGRREECEGLCFGVDGGMT